MRKRHGMDGTPTHTSWRALRQRCNTSTKDNKYYLSKGISYDPRWECFTLFLEDMGLRPEGKTLDRIDNSKDYCKENCRWATAKEQVSNRGTWSKLGEKHIVQYKYGYRVKISGVIRKRVKTLEAAIKLRNEYLELTYKG